MTDHNYYLEFTRADLDFPATCAQKVAAQVVALYDGTSPVRGIAVARAMGINPAVARNYLGKAGRAGLLVRVPRKGWLPPPAK